MKGLVAMNGDEGTGARTYKVVVNQEEQYSIWPADRTNPPGWRDAGRNGLEAECLGYIEQVWTDMRPLSLRQHMEEVAGDRAAPPAESPRCGQAPRDSRTGDDLVDRLCEGDHPVEASVRPERTVERFKERVDGGYLHVTFTDTEGGTELGMRLDRDRLDLSQADFERRTGTVRLVGMLTLNDVKVCCMATIELSTLTGQGHLEPVEA